MTEKKSSVDSTTKKHKLKPADDAAPVASSKKKSKQFAAKEFRKQLKTDYKLTALNTFLELIVADDNDNEQNCILAYLENGGNCIEIFQTIENESNVAPVLAFEIVHRILLEVHANYGQFYESALEACRYFLNTYLTLINKMLGLSSSTKERTVMLKLLTIIVTMSTKLAKDILMQVNFNTATLELLTKSMRSTKQHDVRRLFSHFLVAFLVDDYSPTMACFLDKRYLLTSIIGGLKYDQADDVCMIVTAMKSRILEHPVVSKTVKMRLFSTPVVRDLVNLYNWKGPAGVQEIGKKATTTANIRVDEVDKSKVSEAIHAFLLVLCTSHKYGVIFRDHSLGLGKKIQNSLMFTILESLDRPWEHSYAKHLVTKICGACPDLVKTMWMNLKSSLEPRLTDRWLNAMEFAQILLHELDPKCLDYGLNKLNAQQLSQIINYLVMPTPILNILLVIPEQQQQLNKNDDNSKLLKVKYEIMILLREMLRTLSKYIDYIETTMKSLRPDDDNNNNNLIGNLKQFLTNQIARNFPSVEFILDKLNMTVRESTYLNVAFDLFEFYQKFSLHDQLLNSLISFNIDIKKFLQIELIQIKVIRYYLINESNLFEPTSDLFPIALSCLLKFYYYNNNNMDCRKLLNDLLVNTGIFPNDKIEINIWIDAVLNLKKYNDDNLIALYLVDIIRLSGDNFLKYTHTLGDLKLSPLIIAVLSRSNQDLVENNKIYNYYLQFVVFHLFHLLQQRNNELKLFNELINNNNLLINKNLLDYIKSWSNNNGNCLMKWKGVCDYTQKFSVAFFSNDLDQFLTLSCTMMTTPTTPHIYSDLTLNLLQASIFYFSNQINKLNYANCLKYIKFIIINQLLSINNDDLFKRYLDVIFINPVLHDNFVDLNNDDNNYCTKFLLELVNAFNDNKQLKTIIDTKYLGIYRQKLFDTIKVILLESTNNNFDSIKSLLDVLNIIHLNYEHCYEILLLLDQKIVEKIGKFSLIFQYCLGHLAKLCGINKTLKPLPDENFNNYCNYYCLNHYLDNNNVVDSLLDYLKVFPHSISSFPLKLFETIINGNVTTDFNQVSVDLLSFLLERNKTLFYDKYIKLNIETICQSKGLLLCLLDVIINNNYDDDLILLKLVYDKIEQNIIKVLQKPHKASQHYRKHYQSVAYLIDRFMSIETCRCFVDKIQKFEQNNNIDNNLFHVVLLGKIFDKFCNNNDNSSINQEKVFMNIVLTFINLLMKSKNELLLTEKFDVFYDFLCKFSALPCRDIIDTTNLINHDNFSQFCKFSLKYGVNGESILLKILTKLIEINVKSLKESDVQLILDMLLSHSEFFDVILRNDKINSDNNNNKGDLLSLLLILIENYPILMARNHIPILLASYRGTINTNDQIILKLLQLYEMKSSQTQFYDFKPFLWGPTATNLIHKNVDLTRQPKMGDVLDLLQEDLVNQTINNNNCYDLKFFLPLFSNLLAAENCVQLYRFTRSGALSLTIISLNNTNKSIRLAGCHVLSRFNYHLDAKPSKDRLLWLRLVKAICVGIIKLDEMKINSFVAIYFAKIALILTNPNNLMYVPSTQYLSAKSLLNFNTIPELYTFLHSCDVNYKEHRQFILIVIKRGLRTEHDFNVFVKSMAFKLLSDFYNSSLCDLDCHLLILDIYLSCTRLPFKCVKILLDNYSFLPLIYDIFMMLLNNNYNRTDELFMILNKLIQLLNNIVIASSSSLSKSHDYLIFLMLMALVSNNNNNILKSLSVETLDRYYGTLVWILKRNPDLFRDKNVELLLRQSDCHLYEYLSRYGCNFLRIRDLDNRCPNDNLKVLYYEKFKQIL